MRQPGDSRASKPVPTNVGASSRDFQEFQAEFRRKLGLIDSDREHRQPSGQSQQRKQADSRSGHITAERIQYSFNEVPPSKSTDMRPITRTQESAAEDPAKKSREIYSRFLEYNERADTAEQRSGSRLLGANHHEIAEKPKTKRSIISSHELDSGYASPSVYFPYIYSLKSHTSTITSITTDCFGKLWSASLDHTVKSWNILPNAINLGTRLSALSSPQTLAKHRKGVNCIVAHTREPLIFSGSDDKMIAVWNCSDAGFKRFYKGHQGCVIDLQVLERTLISAGSDHAFKVFSTSTQS